MIRDRLVVGQRDQSLSEPLQMDAELNYAQESRRLACSSECVKKQQQVLRSDNQHLVKTLCQESSRKTAEHFEGELNNKPSGWCGNAVLRARFQYPAKKFRCLNYGKFVSS